MSDIKPTFNHPLSSESVDKIVGALVKARQQFNAIENDGSNTFFKSKYALLSTVIEAIEKPLANHDLMLVQHLMIDGENHFLKTALYHTSGQFIASYVRIPKCEKLHEFGTMITYLKRYSINALLCLYSLDDIDDDGNQEAKSKTVNKLIKNGQVQYLHQMAEKHPAFKKWLEKEGHIRFESLHESTFAIIMAHLASPEFKKLINKG